MAQGAHLTGGYGSTYAQSAAQQAYNSYLARISDVLPELQEAAYKRYRDDGAALLEQYELLRSRDEEDYERYVDALNAWKSERSAAQKRYDGRISPAQRTRFKSLFAGYNVDIA